jgi:hypothetical protein
MRYLSVALMAVKQLATTIGGDSTKVLGQKVRDDDDDDDVYLYKLQRRVLKNLYHMFPNRPAKKA